MHNRTTVEIPLEQLHDSPFNPPARAGLAITELAANILAEGRIHQALLVRPRLVDDDPAGYEIVFGHRRRYAAEVAGLSTAPCEVREMSDAQARSAQASENLQREGLKALEEAAAYQAMIDNDGLSANQVAEAIGKSRSHVYGRLRLLDLCPQVREALLAGEVKSEVALLIARVGDEKMQGKALQAIRAHNGKVEDGGAGSYRRIRELLNEKFTLALDKAIFPIVSADLVPSAGSCTDCAKRTGNAPEYADVASQPSSGERDAAEQRAQAAYDAAMRAGDEEAADSAWDAAHDDERRDRVRNGGPNICTDPDCFEAKKKAHLKAEAAALAAEGHTLITGGKARQAINAQGELGDGFITVAKIDLGKANGEVKPVTIQNPRDGTTVQAYRAEDLKAAGVKVKAPKAKKRTGYDPQAYAREEAERRIKATHEEAARRAILAAVRKQAAGTARSEFDLRLVARTFFDSLDHRDMNLVIELHELASVPGMRVAINSMDAHSCGLLLLDCAMVRHVSGDEWMMQETPEALLDAAGHYGVDTDAVRQAVQTPANEEPAASAAPKKAKKSRRATDEEQGALL